MQNPPIDLLVTFNRHYIEPFKTMLHSLLCNNPGESFRIWLMHSNIPQEELTNLIEYCSARGVLLTALTVEPEVFANAPVSRQYPQEMYYRLLAPRLLPENLNRILYLDSDILALNPLRPLWAVDLQGKTFAASSHTGVLDLMSGVNRIRMNTDHDYFNTGVILIDLAAARRNVRLEDIFDCVRNHSAGLLLPDQDVFNFLYGSDTLPLPDSVWNYDPRYYSGYLLRSNGQCTLDWVMNHTVFLHFCGKKKPWNASYSNRFASLYKHYMSLARR